MLDPGESLYQRLGGYDAIAAAVDDLLPRLVGDPQIGVFWKGKCVDSMRKDRQLIVEFLCEATGGPWRLYSAFIIKAFIFLQDSW